MPSFKCDTTIQPWGNSLGLRITRPLSELARLKQGTVVTVEVIEGGLLIKPKQPDRRIEWPFSEADLVRGLTPAGAHADELPAILSSELGEE